MFKEILKRLMKARMLTKTQLADEVGVSPGVLEDVMRIMVDAGYLRVDNPESCEPTACGGCAHSASCASDTPSTVYYTVTPKGVDYAEA